MRSWKIRYPIRCLTLQDLGLGKRNGCSVLFWRSRTPGPNRPPEPAARPGRPGRPNRPLLGRLLDAVREFGDLVVERPALRHLLPDLAIGVHHRRVVAPAERLP